MNRRSFLALLASGVAGAALDPERLLWTPGARTIFVPPADGWTREGRILVSEPFTRGDIFTIEGVFATNPVTGRQTKHLQRFVVTADVNGPTITVEKIHPPPPSWLAVSPKTRRARGVLVGQTVQTIDFHRGAFVLNAKA